MTSLAGPAASAQTIILSGHYDNMGPSSGGSGYRTSGNGNPSYTVTPAATFNGNGTGLYLSADFGSISADIYGGTFDSNTSDGLYVEGLNSYNAIVNVYGGSFENNGDRGIITQGQAATVNIYGGTFANNTGPDIFDFDNKGHITLYGTDFSLNGVSLPYGALTGGGLLTGKLQNNPDVLTFTYRGNIVLAPAAAVPEPSPIALLGLALPALGMVVRRRVRR